MKRLIMLAAMLSLALSLPCKGQDQPVKKEPRPRVEVCFVLDTTGSMSDLIEGAKQKIWSIANQIVKRKPTPEVRIALIGYRDKSDEYVTKRFDLTADIDEVFKNLSAFKADGGGDEPESVNQALDEAVNKIAWSNQRDVLKIIFLVGDAPPHMDYKEKQYPDICKDAAKKDLVVNTIQCGQIASTTPVWQEIARLAEGEFAAIGQSGDMIAISAPQDKEIAELNAKLGTTLVPVALGGRGEGRGGGLFGGGGGAVTVEEAARELKAKQEASEAAPASVAADRLVYNARSGKAVQGGAIELLDALATGDVKLADLKDEQLPEELRKLNKEQREAYVANKKKERDAIQAKIVELTKAREQYIEGEKKRLAGSGKKDAFDDKVNTMIEKQAEAKKKR